MGRRTIMGAMAAASAVTLAAPGQAAAPQAAAAAPPVVPRIVPDCSRDIEKGILVCGRRRSGSVYRLPEPTAFDPDGATDSVSRERHRLMDYGAAGTGSCSTVGPGGWTGCDAIAWKEMHQQKDGNAAVGLRARLAEDLPNR
jgi:hypothetical protein